MTVAEINALLYLPGRSRSQLERALRIPALSAGWRGSFQHLLEQEQHGDITVNSGRRPSAPPSSPAWPGFRSVRVVGKRRESAGVTSLLLESMDGLPLTVALPGQFVVLRFVLAAGAPAITRSYSLSGEPSAFRYRITVKHESHGVAGGFVDAQAQVGDALEISPPRGAFILRSGDGPVALLSAGVGVTPVLAMLHALAADASRREIWWLYGARNSRDHPFAEEVRSLLKTVSGGHSHICYSSPEAEDRLGEDFDARGRLNAGMLTELNVPLDADFFICGPSAFMSELTTGLAALGVAPGRIHTEIFGSGPTIAPGIVPRPSRSPHPPAASSETGPLVSFARSGVNAHWGSTFVSLLELAEACDIPTRWACRAGVCHTCEIGLVAGAVAYTPEPIIPAAPGNVLICCSRPEGDIVIDL